MPHTARYDYAVAGRAMPGERQSGDAALVQATARGVLVSAVDGLGHGDAAALAAHAAIAVLREYDGEPLDQLLQRCHESLRCTRGVAFGLALIDVGRSTLTWLGIGNVEAVLITSRPDGKHYRLTNRGGVVGYRLPAFGLQEVPIARGDLLILATDGIDENFATMALPPEPANRLARLILDRHGKVTDDALVVVLRWLGAETTLGSES